MGAIILQGQAVVPGSAKGIALVSQEPLSFWGGYDWETGEIIDRRHPLSGENAQGRILAIPFTRGSSTTTAVLLEALHKETAPAAIITTATDFFFALAAVVAEELFALKLPLVALENDKFVQMNSGDLIEINNEKLRIERKTI
jgi:predicted aconitase with swiveling domain